MPETVVDADDHPDDTWECRLCSAPGGFPYCNDACRDADRPYEDGEWEELGDRLSAEVLALLDSSQRLIVAKAEGAQLSSQAAQARTIAARIVVLLVDLEALGAGSPSGHEHAEECQAMSRPTA